MYRRTLCCLLLSALAFAWGADAPSAAAERRVDLLLHGFFRNGEQPLNVYARLRDGKWVAAVGSSRIPGRVAAGGNYSFNGSYHWVDMSQAPVIDGAMDGPVTVHITPDTWIPFDHQSFTVELQLQAKLTDGGEFEGEYRVLKINSEDKSAAALGKSGKITSKSKDTPNPPIPNPVTLSVHLQGALVGGDPKRGERCLVALLGFKDGKLASAASAMRGYKGALVNVRAFPFEPSDVTIDEDGVRGAITVDSRTLDFEPCQYQLKLDGRFVEGYLVGAYEETVRKDDGETISLAGSFDGKYSPGISQYSAFTPAGEELPWWVPVQGFQPPRPGEHPRLLFRKSDVSELRKKSQTPAGKAMIARLKYLLGGGEAMPTEFNNNKPVNIGAKGPKELSPGAFTVNHAAGFGLLYQLTGDKRYAELSRECLDKVFAGQVDRDERYSWKAPGTGFRLSGVHQGVALAYDLCYDAWPESYRRKVVDEIQTNSPGALQKSGELSLEMLARGGKYPPSSNHFGAYVAGAGFAALAIQGDPGADDDRLDKIRKTVEASMKLLFTSGYGDGGWFGEGTGSDKTAMLPGIVGLIESLRVAGGQDWCGGKPNARMIILTRALELIPGPDAVHRPERGHYAYGTRFWKADRSGFRDQGGWSADGLFAIGIGALSAEYRPGMAWIYDNFVEPDMKPEERIYEARIDPLHAVYAFVNWPLDEEPANPAKTFPMAVHDNLHGYVLCRNRFRDSDDCLVTGLARRGPTGYHKRTPSNRVMVWGLGMRTTMGSLSGATTHWQAGADGSACFTLGGVAWAVDYSGASGAPAVLVNVGGEAGKPAASGAAKATAQRVTAGGKTFHLLVLCEGDPPQARADGDAVVIGAQRISLEDGNIALGKFRSAD